MPDSIKMEDESILTLTKRMLGIEKDYDAFDLEILTHINYVFSQLHQIGLGPNDGFEITGDDEKWADYLLGDKRLNTAKSYMYARVRLIFDPPTSGAGMSALQDMCKEMEWRLNVQSEEVKP